MAFQVLAVALIIQQIVENGIAPKVLGSVTGLNPFWVFVSILTGARVGGLLGVVVAVPTAVLIKEALESIRTTRKSDSLPSSETMHRATTLEPHVPNEELIDATKEKVPGEV